MRTVLAPSVAALPFLLRLQASTDPSLVFEKLVAMVAMRDGVRLNTEVYVPRTPPSKP